MSLPGSLALVTGGAGFLGSHIARRLLVAGCKVRLLDVQDFRESDISGEVEFIRGDVRDPAVVGKAVPGARWVFHAAARLPVSRAGAEFLDVNVGGTAVLLDACLRHRPERVVHVSTSAVYFGKPSPMPIDESSPLSPVGDYGRSKEKAEALCRGYRRKGLSVCILRCRTLAGTGRLGLFQMLFDWIKDGKRIYILGRGDNPFQLLSAKDMAQACWLAATAPGAGSEDFCLGTDRFGTVRRDLQALLDHAGTSSRIASVPVRLGRGCLRALDALRLSPLADWHYRTMDQPGYFDISKARRLLGFQPTQSNAEMLIEAYDWYLEHHMEYENRYGTTHRHALRQKLLRLLRALS